MTSAVRLRVDMTATHNRSSPHICGKRCRSLRSTRASALLCCQLEPVAPAPHAPCVLELYQLMCALQGAEPISCGSHDQEKLLSDELRISNAS
jgi:hypothetical protein